MTDSSKPGTGKIDVAYVARLARLDLTPEELRTFQGQLEDVVEYVHKIREVDLSGVEPTSHAAPLQNVFREDKVEKGLDRRVVLDNAPVSAGDQFIVPRIVE